jgi:cleavage stimulation factor subunit 3
MTARTALKELRRLLAPLFPETSSTAISLPTRPTWLAESDRTLVHAWKAYLKWEESNPLDIEDASLLQLRVSMAYKKAVARMRFYPEIWSVCKRGSSICALLC